MVLTNSSFAMTNQNRMGSKLYRLHAKESNLARRDYFHRFKQHSAHCTRSLMKRLYHLNWKRKWYKTG